MEVLQSIPFTGWNMFEDVISETNQVTFELGNTQKWPKETVKAFKNLSDPQSKWKKCFLLLVGVLGFQTTDVLNIHHHSNWQGNQINQGAALCASKRLTTGTWPWQRSEGLPCGVHMRPP